MKTTAIYCRTSTNKQDTGLESQLRNLKQYCKTKNIDEYKVYKDYGISGKKVSRPELNKLMVDVRNGTIKTVIVYSFSRFARSTQHLLTALEEFKLHNINFISVSENIDTSTPTGKMIFTVLASISELERELIVERVKLGLENAKAKGIKLGKPKSRNSELIIELRKQNYTYKEISRLAGCSISTVCRELTGYFHKEED